MLVELVALRLILSAKADTEGVPFAWTNISSPDAALGDDFGRSATKATNNIFTRSVFKNKKTADKFCRRFEFFDLNYHPMPMRLPAFFASYWLLIHL
jgi:hypothetical protein